MLPNECFCYVHSFKVVLAPAYIGRKGQTDVNHRAVTILRPASKPPPLATPEIESMPLDKLRCTMLMILYTPSVITIVR